MRLKLIPILLFCLFGLTANAETYPEVVFDNSLVKGTYARSLVDYSGKSWVENVNKHLLVSDTLFFTPGNALSLRYLSHPQGDWNVTIRYSRQKFHYRLSNDDVLSFKLYVGSANTKAEHLPSISIKQRDNQSVSLAIGNYVQGFKKDAWLDVRIPVKEFAGLNVEDHISGIILRQLNDSKSTHQLFLDQIEFLPANYSKVPLTSAAVLAKATAYGNHVDLQWQVPLTQSIRYVKIYRSEDNKNFVPISIRPTYMQRCLDYVPVLDKKYYYKIAWLDYNYKESPLSAVQEVQPKKISDDELFSLIQIAHINYFVENYDINTGMHMPFRMKEKAIVSVKETGGAILSLMVGVEKNFISRPLFISRVKRIVKFLATAQNKHGFFPSYYDGRKGIPEYFDRRPQYDVESSAAIMEALLVVRQYLKGDDEAEKEIRRGISDIWERMDWKAVTMPYDPQTLRSNLDMLDEYFVSEPIVGVNLGLNAYMLAMASTRSNIPIESFSNAIESKYVSRAEVTSNLFADTTVSDSVRQNSLFPDGIDHGNQDSLFRVSAFQDTIMYGVELPFGAPDGNLLEMYRPFVTINPKLAKLKEYKLAEVVGSYARVVKRRDNEMGVGTSNSDIWGFQQRNDSIGTFRINPAISVASIFLDNQRSIKSLNALYHEFGAFLFSEYGFRSWVDLRSNDVSDEYVASNQANVALLLENAKTGFIWKLYQQIPEIQAVEQRLFKK